MRKIVLFWILIFGVLNVYAQSMEWLYRPGYFSVIQYMGHDLFKVKNEQEKYGVVSAEGKKLLELKYDSITPFVEGRSLVLDKMGKRIYAILNTEGEVVKSFPNRKLFVANSPSYREGLLGFKEEQGLSGYLDINGEIAIRPKFYLVTPFQNGIATVQYSYMDSESEGYYGLIYKSGTSAIISNKKYHFLSAAVSGYLFALTSSVRGGNVLRIVRLEDNGLKDVEKLESKMFIDISDDFTHLTCQNGHQYYLDNQWRISGSNYDLKLPYTIEDQPSFMVQTSELLSKQHTEKGVQITYKGRPIMEHSFNKVATYEKKYAIVFAKNKRVGVLKLNPSAGIELIQPTEAVIFNHNPLPADLSTNIQEVDSRHSVKIKVNIKDINPKQLKCYLNEVGYLSYVPLKKEGNDWYLHIPYFQADSAYNHVITKKIDIAVTYDGLDWMHRSLSLSSKHEQGYDVFLEGSSETPEDGKGLIKIRVQSLKGFSNVKTRVTISGRESVSFMGVSHEIPIEVYVPEGSSKTFTYDVLIEEPGCPVIRKEFSKVITCPKKMEHQKKMKKRIKLI